MIIKSIARSQFIVPNSNDRHAKLGMIEVDEKCALCDRLVPTGVAVLRRKENNRLLCLPCIIDIAELNE